MKVILESWVLDMNRNTVAVLFTLFLGAVIGFAAGTFWNQRELKRCQNKNQILAALPQKGLNTVFCLKNQVDRSAAPAANLNLRERTEFRT